MRTRLGLDTRTGCTVQKQTLVLRSGLWKAAVLLFLLGFAGIPLASATDRLAATDYLVNHAYVSYTSDHVPCSEGVIEDVTNTLTCEDGHTYDLYGNILVFSTTNSSISDVNGQAVGFVYVTSPGL